MPSLKLLGRTGLLLTHLLITSLLLATSLLLLLEAAYYELPTTITSPSA